MGRLLSPFGSEFRSGNIVSHVRAFEPTEASLRVLLFIAIMPEVCRVWPLKFSE